MKIFMKRLKIMKEPIPKSDADQKTQSKTSLQIVKNKVKNMVIAAFIIKLRSK